MAKIEKEESVVTSVVCTITEPNFLVRSSQSGGTFGRLMLDVSLKESASGQSTPPAFSLNRRSQAF